MIEIVSCLQFGRISVHIVILVINPAPKVQASFETAIFLLVYTTPEHNKNQWMQI